MQKPIFEGILKIRSKKKKKKRQKGKEGNGRKWCRRIIERLR